MIPSAQRWTISAALITEIGCTNRAIINKANNLRPHIVHPSGYWLLFAFYHISRKKKRGATEKRAMAYPPGGKP